MTVLKDFQLNPLPSHSGIAHINGGFETILDALEYAAQGGSGLNFYTSQGELASTLSYAALKTHALETAEKLIGAGLTPGDCVALIAETGPDFPITFFACQYAGLIPCPVPFTTYMGGKDAYIDRVIRMMRSCKAKLLIGPESIATILGNGPFPDDAKLLTFSQLSDMAAHGLHPFERDGIAYIQFSSGSTSQPKGIVITQKALSANVTGILRHGMRLTSEDRAFSWLPFYHDMGLVGFLLAPMFGQCTVDYLPVSAFVRRPSLWLQLMSDNKNTISYAPTFGYNLVADRFRAEEHAELDLSNWRIAGIGGDMIRSDVLHKFAQKIKMNGFSSTAFLPSFGMAEATLALTFATEGLTLDTLDDAEIITNSRTYVVCGQALPQHDIKIVNDDGASLPDLSIGHIWVRGPSLMLSYLGQPELTSQVMKSDGFMDTGDLGYMRQGSLVVTGRAKDLILRNGRNIWPDDIERSAEAASGLSHGNVVAFPVEDESGSDEIILLVQKHGLTPADQDILCQKIIAAVSQSEGVNCKVVVVPPRTIPLTSSGKLQRNAARDIYLAGIKV